MSLRLLPGLLAPVERTTFLISRPLRFTPTPASRSFTTNTGRSASKRRDRYSMPPVSAVGTLPLAARRTDPKGPDGRFRRSPSHVPCQSRRPGSRRLHAGHHLASHRDIRQAHHKRTARPLAFDATSILLTTHQQRTPTPTPGWALSGTSSWSPPDASTAPSPDRSPRRSSANAASGGLTPSPEGRRRRANKPPSPAQHRLYEDRLHQSSFNVRDTRLSRNYRVCPGGLRRF